MHRLQQNNLHFQQFITIILLTNGATGPTKIRPTAIKLEILTAKPAGTPKPFKLLFIHGICVGGWVWQKNFLPFFANAGYEAHALSLRGHGGSEGAENLPTTSLNDYTDDLASAVETIGGPLIVIGHSLGGAVVQNWLRIGGKPSAVALLASVPPWGLANSAVRMGFTNPVLFAEVAKMATMGIHSINPEILRQGLFSESYPAADFTSFTDRAQNESLIISAELQGYRPIAPMPWQFGWHAPPLLVMGAENDKLIPTDEVWRTGLYYGTKATMVPGLAHAMMLDTNWEAAATPLLNWLGTLKQ